MADNRDEELLSMTRDELDKLLRSAYEMGVSHGRELEGLAMRFEKSRSPLRPLTPATAEKRAQIGTVKPTIKDLVENTVEGISTADIIARTGFKGSSVRGTLSALKSEGVAERRGDLWVLSLKCQHKPLLSK